MKFTTTNSDKRGSTFTLWYGGNNKIRNKLDVGIRF